MWGSVAENEGSATSIDVSSAYYIPCQNTLHCTSADHRSQQWLLSLIYPVSHVNFFVGGIDDKSRPFQES